MLIVLVGVYERIIVSGMVRLLQMVARYALTALLEYYDTKADFLNRMCDCFIRVF